MTNEVSVLGRGSAAARPDVMRVRVGVERSGADIATAMDGATAAMGLVLAAVRGAGVADPDLATVGLSVRPRWDTQANQHSGYECEQQLQVVLRDLTTSGATLRALVQAGGDAVRLNDVTLGVGDERDLVIQARSLAFADARSQAEQYATLAGRTLGQVLAIAEPPDRGGPAPGPVRARHAIAAGSFAAAVPVESGETTVQVEVRITWGLLP